MKSYKSALGKSVDMGAIIAKNEKVRAVGNMKVNARGDTIDSWGRVIKPVTSKVNQAYAGTVGNRSSHVVKKTDNQPVQKIEADKIEQELVQEPIIEEELTTAELDMEAEFEDDELTEQIKAEELRQEQLREAKKGKK